MDKTINNQMIAQTIIQTAMVLMVMGQMVTVLMVAEMGENEKF